MSSGGKSGAGQKTLNYYGTLAVAFSWGPWDWLTGIVSNGDFIWQCSGSGPLDLNAPGVVHADGYVDLTGGLLDPSLVMEGGYLRFYPGLATANPDPALVGHPAYRNTAYLAGKHFFYGQNSGTAPNWQAIGGRVPRVPTSIVAAIDNIADDRQINPVAALAEFFLDERGGSVPQAKFHAASWLAAAHWCAQDAAHRAYSFVSPLITELADGRDIVRRLLDPINGFVRWTDDGKLGCYIYEWGLDPGGLVTLDARHFTKPPRIKDGDWKDIPTEVVVSFWDRAYEFQQNTVSVPNQLAAEIRRTDDLRRLDRPDVTRASQAHAHGEEWMRREGSAPGRATLYVRRPIVSALRPGDKIKFDDDPEPGGAGAAQMARIDRIETDDSDEAQLAVTIDPLLPATAYTPDWISPLPDDQFAGAIQTCPSLVHMLALPLPTDYWGWPPAVGFVATRPSTQIAGFHAYFATDAADPFTELGVQVGFAARCQLVNPVSDSAGTLRLQLLDGATGPDAYIAADTPGGNVAQAEDNKLFALLVSLDGSGRVALDGDGQPIMEFTSIVQRSAVSADTHDYTVYRGRASSTARAWAAAAVCWIVPAINLVPFHHDLFETMFGQVGYFRLGAFTLAAVDETHPLPGSNMVFPSIPTPNNLTATNGTGKAVQLDWLLSTEKSFAGEYAVYRRTTAPLPVGWAKIAEVSATRFTDHAVLLGSSYEYKIVAITPAEDESAFSNVVSITVAKVLAADIDTTPPNDPGAPTFVSSSAYVASDGTVRSTIIVRVQALAAAGGGKVAATLQELRYRLVGSGATGWTIQDQPENGGGTKDIPVDDLTPGGQYEFEVQSYSRFNIPSTNAVAATGSPFTAAAKTAKPANPTGFTAYAPDSSNPVQPYFDENGSQWYAALVTFVPSTAKDKRYYVFVEHTSAVTPPVGTTGRRCDAEADRFVYYRPIISGFVYLWVSTVDSSENQSDWEYTGYNLQTYLRLTAGNMSSQDDNDVKVSGIKVGSFGAGSVQQQKATVGDSAVYNSFVGGAPTETFILSIASKGFDFKPDDGVVSYQDGQELDFDYLKEHASTNASQVVIRARTRDGSNIAASPVRFGYRFWSH